MIKKKKRVMEYVTMWVNAKCGTTQTGDCKKKQWVPTIVQRPLYMTQIYRIDFGLEKIYDVLENHKFKKKKKSYLPILYTNRPDLYVLFLFI